MTRVTVLVLLMVLSSTHYAKEHQSSLDIEGQLLAHFQHNSAMSGWGNNRAGKLVDGDANETWHAQFDISYRIADTLTFESTVATSDADFSEPIGVTELFFKWRPIPTGRIRHAVKTGVFYPPVSLENTDTGWQSPSTNSFSAINTWIAEEVRVMGIEFEHSIRANFFDSRDTFRVRHALFMGNDPAGALLAWKGWSVHQRQTLIGEELPLLPLSVFEPGAPFQAQADHIDPFVEVDDKPGHYVALDWVRGNQFLLRGVFYDNRANPEVTRRGQYGWRTRFYSLGLTTHWRGVNLTAQAITGDTRMGTRLLHRNPVDNQFSSEFILLSREIDNHSIAIRRDWFRIKDRDVMTVWDPNQEQGAAWTVSYAYAFNDRWSVETEWLSIQTRRAAWLLFNETASQKERQVRLGFRYQF